MGKEEFAVVIDDRAARRGAVEICKAVRVVVYRLIDARQQVGHSAVNIVDAAKGPNQAGFALRITLAHGQLLVVVRAGDLRALRPIVPVGISRQRAIHAQERLVGVLKHKFPVRAA